MSFIRNVMNKLRRNEEGATAIEYGLIAALIAVVIIGVLSQIGTGLEAKFKEVNSGLRKGASSSASTN